MDHQMVIRPPKGRETLLSPWWIRRYVRERLKKGSMFMAPADAYNNEFCRRLSERWVVDFSRNVILTTDWRGKPESYQYFEVYQLLSGKKMRNTDEDKEAAE